MYCSPPGASIHGIILARILEWVAIFLLHGVFPTQSSLTTTPASAGRFFTTEPSAAAAAAKSLQSCPICVTPQTAAYQAPPSLGFSRQEYWSGLPSPSLGLDEAQAKIKIARKNINNLRYAYDTRLWQKVKRN